MNKEAAVGLSLALPFMGGALGKAACGWLGQRLGVVWSVIATESGDGPADRGDLPFAPMQAVLPLLGVFLNGASSMLYGTVRSSRQTATSGPGSR
jgi:hypothetical protein